MDDWSASHIATFIHRSDEAERERARKRREQLIEAARELARRLVGAHGAFRVWLFGSLAWGEPDEASDIDLAVEGLDELRYFPALGGLLAVAPTRVDLVRMEEAEPSLRARVLEAGLLLEGNE